MRSKLGFTLDTVLSGGRMVRCHHGSQGASFALSSCVVGLTLGPSVCFFCLSGSRADLLPYSSQPNPLAADDNNKARLAVSWLDSVVDRIFTGCLLLSHGDLLGSPASFKRFCDSLGVLPVSTFRKPVDLFAAHLSLHLSHTDIRSYSLKSAYRYTSSRGPIVQ